MAEEWLSIDDLLAYANDLHEVEVPYAGKMLKLHWRELKANEQPSKDVVLARFKNGEEVTNQKMVWCMLEEVTLAKVAKGEMEYATQKGTEPITIEKLRALPDALKTAIVMQINGIEKEMAETFFNGPMTL